MAESYYPLVAEDLSIHPFGFSSSACYLFRETWNETGTRSQVRLAQNSYALVNKFIKGGGSLRGQISHVTVHVPRAEIRLR